MNPAVARQKRFPISPYARRLARERGLPLEALRGSGPAGRILAADVLAFVPAAAPAAVVELDAPAATAVVAAIRTAAFSTSVALGALRDLLAALEASGRPFELEDILLCAAGRTSAVSFPASTAGVSIALEVAGRQVVFTGAADLSLTGLRTERLAAGAGSREDAGKPAPLSLRLLPAGDIRPVVMPLLPDRVMRLIVSVNAAGDHAECLLVADTASVDEAVAVKWLSAFKSAMEQPLRLFV
jgi:hypothetical protein